MKFGKSCNVRLFPKMKTGYLLIVARDWLVDRITTFTHDELLLLLVEGSQDVNVDGGLELHEQWVLQGYDGNLVW